MIEIFLGTDFRNFSILDSLIYVPVGLAGLAININLVFFVIFSIIDSKLIPK